MIDINVFKVSQHLHEETVEVSLQCKYECYGDKMRNEECKSASRIMKIVDDQKTQMYTYYKILERHYYDPMIIVALFHEAVNQQN